MSYQISHRYTFMPSNLDSYFDDVAWVVVVRDSEGELVCDVINDGKHGTEIFWLNDEVKAEMLQKSMSVLPDSIDPLRDFIDTLIERHYEESKEAPEVAA